MKQLLDLIESLLGGKADQSLLVKIGFKAAAIAPDLLFDGDAHLSAEHLNALSELVLDARNGRL